ncbi:hypothetical protein QYM36_011202 [Artemia franciscana]|uniref:Uncharacterized protein n=1 Tax=Artemia franciscana TaxID=6661 RepID=A0AA88HJH4_ARTSF|nr:hypothetical protein QYM36_011202 [Artemia franciscana]
MNKARFSLFNSSIVLSEEGKMKRLHIGSNQATKGSRLFYASSGYETKPAPTVYSDQSLRKAYHNKNTEQEQNKRTYHMRTQCIVKYPIHKVIEQSRREDLLLFYYELNWELVNFVLIESKLGD